MSVISFQNVSKEYDKGSQVIKDFSVEIPENAFVMLVGPSGCGKTTLLKMINKLILPTSGTIQIQGKNIQDWDTIALRRSIGYVIQQVGLFPHMTIKDNINYVLRIMNTEKHKREERAAELINLVGMDESYLTRYPRELSGGQQQRIGVARALAADPEIILMDEPFGAVDEIARRNLQVELKEIHEKVKKTIVFVTHDIHEALKLGTVILLINQGKIEQMGTKEDLVFRPKTPFVKSFFGLKGFNSTLDEQVLSDLYEDILSGKKTLKDIASSISE